MKQYSVTIYTEVYTSVLVSANSDEEARDMVLSGEYDDDDIEDVTVKESDVLSVDEIEED